MARFAASIEDLGPGRRDGEEGGILLGTTDVVELTWLADPGVWRGEENVMFDLHPAPVVHFGPAAEWKYLFVPQGNPGDFNRSDFGFNPSPIRNVAGAFDAGLTLQEHMVAVWSNSLSDGELATVLYPFDDGDGISGTIDPDPYVSTVLDSTVTATWSATDGWQDSPFDAALVNGKPILAPHLYTRISGSNGTELSRLLVRWRWIGAPS